MDAGKGGQVAVQLTVEDLGAFRVVAIERGVDGEREQMMDVKSGIDIPQVGEAAHEQPGADEKQERETDLSGDQHLAPAGLAASGHGAGLVLESGGKIRTNRAQGRSETEQEGGEGTHGQGETQDPQVGGGDEVDRRFHARHDVGEEPHGPGGDEESQRTPHQG